MSFIQWKQIDPVLYDNGKLTGSLQISGSFFLNDVNILSLVGTSGIFQKTGSFWASNEDIQITGSFGVELKSGDNFQVSTENEGTAVEVTQQGVFVLHPFSSTPTPITGGIMFSGSNEFFVGI